jgi:hypothetical protein
MFASCAFRFSIPNLFDSISFRRALRPLLEPHTQALALKEELTEIDVTLSQTLPVLDAPFGVHPLGCAAASSSSSSVSQLREEENDARLVGFCFLLSVLPLGQCVSA